MIGLLLSIDVKASFSHAETSSSYNLQGRPMWYYVFCCISVCLLIANKVGIEPSSGWRSMSFKNRWRWVETRKRRLGDGGQCCLKASVRSHLVSNNLGVRAVGG